MKPGDYARRLGVTNQTLRNAAKAHRTPWQPGMPEVPVAEQDAAWARLYRDGHVKNPPPGGPAPSDDDEGGGDGSVVEAKRRRAWADAHLAEIKLARARKDLVDVASVEAMWSQVAAAVNALLESMPAKLGPLLPGEPRANMTIIRDTVRDMRTDLSAQVETIAAETEAAADLAASQEEPEPETEPDPPKKKRGRPPKKAAK